MEFDLPPDLALLRDSLRRFVDDELIPIEMSTDAADTSDARFAQLQDQVRELGLWHLGVPEELGGAGLGLLGRCVVEEEFARTNAFPSRIHELLGPPVPQALLEATSEQRTRWLQPVLDGRLTAAFVAPDWDPATDPARLRVAAERDGPAYVMDGDLELWTASKPDLLVVLARTGATGVTCLVVESVAAGVSVAAASRTMLDQPLWHLRLDRVAVPEANRIGVEGQAGEMARRWLAMDRIRRHGARGVGIASRALDMAASYAKSRITFGKPLAARQVIRVMLADSMTEVRLARLLVHEAASQFDAGEDASDLSSMVKITATETATRVVDRAMQIHGGVGLTVELPLQHWFRELRGARVVDGGNERLRDSLAGRLVGRR